MTAEVHPGHVATSGLAPDGECGFFSGDWDSILSDPKGRYERHMAGTCREPARYHARSRYVDEVPDWNDHDYDLCEAHAAHARACPSCQNWLASLRTFGQPYVRREL